MQILKKTRKSNPRIVYRTLKDGRLSLYLEYYFGYDSIPISDMKHRMILHRRYKALKLYLIARPSNESDKLHNKQVIELANQIRVDKAIEFNYKQHGKERDKPMQRDFLHYFRDYVLDYQRKDARMFRACLKRFEDFLRLSRSSESLYIMFSELNTRVIQQFVHYLNQRSKGEGARSFYQRFKRVVRQAVSDGLIMQNPCDSVRCTAQTGVLKKDILSLEEIRSLSNVPCYQPEVGRAFLFCLYTGLRFCDVEQLVYANIDRSNRLLSFDQKKTEGHSSQSRVYIPLNATVDKLIGEMGGAREKVFNLPAYTTCLFVLRVWVESAGIKKHITWHCARHSFAVNLLSDCQVDIKTISSLLGHSSLEHTQKYTRVIDSLKVKAMAGLPNLDL